MRACAETLSAAGLTESSHVNWNTSQINAHPKQNHFIHSDFIRVSSSLFRLKTVQQFFYQIFRVSGLKFAQS